MKSTPVAHLDRSSKERGIYLESNGQQVDLESAFATGIVIRPEDMPAVATLLARLIETREELAR